MSLFQQGLKWQAGAAIWNGPTAGIAAAVSSKPLWSEMLWLGWRLPAAGRRSDTAGMNKLPLVQKGWQNIQLCSGSGAHQNPLGFIQALSKATRQPWARRTAPNLQSLSSDVPQFLSAVHHMTSTSTANAKRCRSSREKIADGIAAAKLLSHETLNFIDCRKCKCLLDGQGQPSFLAKAQTSITNTNKTRVLQFIKAQLSAEPAGTSGKPPLL